MQRNKLHGELQVEAIVCAPDGGHHWARAKSHEMSLQLRCRTTPRPSDSSWDNNSDVGVSAQRHRRKCDANSDPTRAAAETTRDRQSLLLFHWFISLCFFLSFLLVFLWSWACCLFTRCRGLTLMLARVLVRAHVDWPGFPTHMCVIAKETGLSPVARTCSKTWVFLKPKKIQV